jgi:hypothetical protein
MRANAGETDECGRCDREGITEAGDEGAGEIHSMGGENSEVIRLDYRNLL